jgi:hypothetical protein
MSKSNEAVHEARLDAFLPFLGPVIAFVALATTAAVAAAAAMLMTVV